ncbi:hypothetical protein CDAR_455501 [Caerostris darwini]|uniref:Methyltransferase domain-containing protein n=1 Tax=Caerostris darwini TaxID=1538125 RepID=A0AAV4RGP1_9ARAC|nr:hypothetical protein CDAR_455501 [Caerostris darwini]
MSDLHIEQAYDCRDFLRESASKLNWTELEKDTFMDIECAGGLISTTFLLKLFPDIKKVIAIDTHLESDIYENPKVAYHKADITKSTFLVAWKGKIIKIISFHCFNYLPSFDEAVENVSDLMVPNGVLNQPLKQISQVLQLEKERIIEILEVGGVSLAIWHIPHHSVITIRRF